MSKRILKVNKAVIMPWGDVHLGVYVLMAHMAERDKERGWPVGTDIRTSTVITLNGEPVNGIAEGHLAAGDVVETLNTIYEVV